MEIYGDNGTHGYCRGVLEDVLMTNGKYSMETTKLDTSGTGTTSYYRVVSHSGHEDGNALLTQLGSRSPLVNDSCFLAKFGWADCPVA